ncbi:hypothetical protein JKA74_05800 [Marivirga sp. S37H4]|uniref:Uncharacterized protein n=1 Tax=Marivirga aurantiaca TaxID=2802615 RepID=A0A934WXC4_9BACT|nr:hypothetical protein [Marivirga aurantiaca]MBK6264545.1 hypothetical protein [Marivirga aurantiaca]
MKNHFLNFLLSFSLIYLPIDVVAQFELDSLKNKWEVEGRHDIEGIYSLNSSSRTYSIALARENDVYKLVYLSGDQENWLYGDLKAIVAPSEEKIYEGRWNAGRPEEPLLEDIKIVFGDKKFILYWSDWSIDEFRMTFPEKAESKTNINKAFDDEIFRRNNIVIPIQKTDSGLVEFPLLVNDVLQIYVSMDKINADVVVSKDIAQTLIQTRTLGYKEWVEGNFYEFIDKNKPLNSSHIFLIKSLKVGSEEINNVKAVISKDLSQSMLINIKLLEKIGKVNIDLDKELLTITKK